MRRADKISLLNLMADTTEALVAAAQDRASMRDSAVNWADLSCTQAAMGMTSDQHLIAIVWIEEAAPDNPDFQAYIRAHLQSKAWRHWRNVQVITQW